MKCDINFQLKAKVVWVIIFIRAICFVTFHRLIYRLQRFMAFDM